MPHFDHHPTYTGQTKYSKDRRLIPWLLVTIELYINRRSSGTGQYSVGLRATWSIPNTALHWACRADSLGGQGMKMAILARYFGGLNTTTCCSRANLTY